MADIKIYIVSRGNPERMHTARLLKEAKIPFELVVDDFHQRGVCEDIGYDAIVCGEQEGDLVAKRNWITRIHERRYKNNPELYGSFYIGMDDNIQEFTRVVPEYLNNVVNPTTEPSSIKWRQVYNQPCHPMEFYHSLEALVALARNVGAPYGGVATMENPYFRAKRHSFRRFVKTKIFIMDATAGITFKHSMCHDSYATAQAIAKYGRVVVDNFLFYKARWYEKGGLGNRQDREAKGLLEQLQACCEEFPGLVAVARGKNSALRIMRVQDASVNLWRREHGYL